MDEKLKSHIIHVILYIDNKQHHENVFYSRFRDIAPDYKEFDQIRSIHNYILESADENSIKTYENTFFEKTSTNIIEEILNFAKRHIE